MRHKAVFALASAGIGAAALLVAPPAGAQEELLPINVEPASGPVGTVITVSGSDCASTDPGAAPEVDIILADEDFFFTEEEGVVAAEALVEAEGDGTWSSQLTVPDDVDPEVVWFVGALCFAGPDAEEPLAVYDLFEFDVTGPSTTPTTSPPATTPPTAPPEAPPAVPVVEEPTFTG
ncbi:MAG: hypothetical protein ACRDZ0_15470 [Acidimicrobiales bacterium]